MEALAHLWNWLIESVVNPQAISALAALVTSFIIDNGWKKALACGVFSYFLTPLLMWQFSIPAQGAPGVGLLIAVFGVHGIVERIRGANLQSVIDAIRKPK